MNEKYRMISFVSLLIFTAFVLLFAWIRHDFGPDTALMVFGGIALLAAWTIGYLLSMANTKINMRTFVKIMRHVEEGNEQQFKALHNIKSQRPQPSTIDADYAQLPPPTWTPAPQRLLESALDDDDMVRIER